MRTRDAVRARRWLWATLIPALIMLGAAAWLAVQLAAVHVGTAQSRTGDYAAAERSFALGTRASVVEHWIPVFDHGTAQYHQGLWDGAAADFERAAGLAPADAQCRIRLNWAWSLEAGADEFLAGDDMPGAMVRLQQAQLILSTAECHDALSPTDDSGTPQGTLEQQWDDTRERIENKSDDAPPVDDDENEGRDESQDSDLADRQQQAQEQRQQLEDQTTAVSPDDGQRTW